MNKRNLTTILLAEAFVLATSACDKHSNYLFNGMIGDEQVIFLEEGVFSQNRLIITRTDGTIVEYLDSNSDLEIECVLITRSGKVSYYYDNNEFYKDFFAVGQSQFKAYLEKIFVLKQNKALDDINY